MPPREASGLPGSARRVDESEWGRCGGYHIAPMALPLAWRSQAYGSAASKSSAETAYQVMYRCSMPASLMSTRCWISWSGTSVAPGSCSRN